MLTVLGVRSEEENVGPKKPAGQSAAVPTVFPIFRCRDQNATDEETRLDDDEHELVVFAPIRLLT